MRKLVHPSILAVKAKQGLRRASQTGGIFHLWFHPSNFYFETDVQFGILEEILKEAHRMAGRGTLVTLPMEAYASA